MHEYQGKYRVTGLKLVLAALAVIVGLALGGTTTAGASGTGVDESVSLRLTSTGFTRSSLKGFARLQLHISEQNGSSFRASAQVESDGLIENRIYAMWLAEPGGNTRLIDTGRADEECEVDPDTGKEIDCERVVDLRGFLAHAPFNVSSLEGLTINIREHVIGPQGIGPVLATGTVTRSDLARFNVSNPPLIVGANIANSLGELPDLTATIGSSGKPTLAGIKIGSPFDEERRRIEEEEEEDDEDDEEEEQEAGLH